VIELQCCNISDIFSRGLQPAFYHMGVLMRARFAGFALVPVLLFCIAVSAQVKSPQDFLGFRVGDDYKLADWQQITGYFNELGKASDRIHVDVIGQTTLKKPFPRDDHVS
jgi:hypothetical protein